MAAAAGILFTFSLSSCSGHNTSDASSDRSTIDTTLHATEIDMTVLSAVRSYALPDTAATDSLYLSIAADMQWPKIIGHHDIKVLQDSIRRICFPSDARDDIEQALLSYVADIRQAGFNSEDATSITRVVQENTNSYSISTTGKFLDFGKRLITYQAEKYAYLGGAHPNTSIKIFTFDLMRGKVITIKDLISAEKMPLFTIGLKKQLADQCELTIAELNQDLLVKEFTVSNDIYIEDGFIYVHYDPYEILPYSMGPINVEMSPYEYSSLLTPYGKELLLD